MTRWIETDSLSDQNISSALAIGAYTADANRLIICDVMVDQVAGSGDYVMYVTKQIGGAGSAYVVIPKTTMTAAAGETAISGQSGFIFVRSGDVLTVYVDGLAGDTATPDTIVRWAELAALRPTTPDLTLDVAATGEAGLDFSNIKQASAPTTLTNITMPTVSTVTDGLTAAQVWSYATRTLSSFGTLVADIWAGVTAAFLAKFFTQDSGSDYASSVAGSVVKEITDNAGGSSLTAASIWANATRTLTQTAAQVVAAIAGGEINIYRDSKTTISLTGLGSLAGRTKLYFTIKKAQSLADADGLSIMQIEETGGLLYLNAAAPVSPVIAADCSMTVTDAVTGAVTIVIKMRPAASLTEISDLAYSLKMITSADNDGRNVTTGTANILASSTRSTT